MAIAAFTSFVQQFDNDGAVLNGGTITVYEDGTTTPIQLYNDPDLAGGHETTNPITLDSAGRHAITYFTAQAYKVLVKDSAGATIYTRDNIDPGVPIGSGALPIANGGTAATTAGTALSNLGGATAAELADVAADVASLSGTLASTEKTHIATGTTAQRPASPAEGDIRRNTTTSEFEFYTGAAWANVRTDVNFLVATQAQQEAGTANTAFVSPGRFHFHHGSAKGSVFAGVTGAANGTTYNVTSVTDNDTGDVTINWATDFPDGNHIDEVTPNNAAAISDVRVSAAAAGTTQILNTNSAGSAADPGGYYVVVFGDFA